MKTAVLAKDGIKIRNLIRTRPPVNDPTEPMYELEITKQKQKNEKRIYLTKKKNVSWENNETKVRERGALYNNFPWDEADAKVRSYIFLYLGPVGQCQLQQKRPGLNRRSALTKKTRQILEDTFIKTRIIVFEKHNFICRKQQKNETLKNF